MDILISYRGIPNQRGWATGDCLVRAAQKLGHNARPCGNYYQTNEWINRDIGNPDLLIFLECNDNDPQYTNLLSLDCKRVMWDFDTGQDTAHTNKACLMARYFHHVFLANPDYLWLIKDSIYLPYAVDPTLNYPCAEKTRDAAIIGTPFQKRVEFAEKIGVPIISGVYMQDYTRALSSLRVSVHNYSSGGRGLLVGRIFETMGCRTCLLAEHQSSLMEAFQNEVHFLAYSSAADCKEKIKYLLDNDVYRQSIEINAYNNIIENHTYEKRLQRIIEEVSK